MLRYRQLFNHIRRIRHVHYSLVPYNQKQILRRRLVSDSNQPDASHIYNCNVKITTLGRDGKAQSARELFDQMPSRDSVSYASMITVHVKNNDLPAAESLFHEMPCRNIIAESAMIDAYAKAGLMDEARQLFDDMPERNAYSWTSIISGYFRWGQPDEARRLFDQMPGKNVVTWTTALLGYARNNLMEQAREIFDLIPSKNIVSWTAMIKCYIENDQIDEACKLFDEMPQRNLYTWSTMISGCLENKRTTEAVQLFNSMPRRNAVSWTAMVTGLAKNGMIELARGYFNQTPEKDVASWNAMISAYVEQGMMVEAGDLFNVMPERNVVTWNAIIHGFSRNGPCGEALRHFIFMLRCRFRPNQTTMTSVVTSSEGMLELKQAHVLSILIGVEPDTSLTNALVTLYSRNGDLNSARFAFENLEAKDVVSWTSMILAYSNHGRGPHAVQIFARMLRSGIDPDEVTFLGVLSGCSHAGLVRKGQKMFNSMSHAYNLEPKAEHYSCLVDILGRAGQVHEAVNVVCAMPPVERDGAVMGALLSACRLHEDGRLADYVADKVIELEPSCSGGYVLLASVYAAQGKWHDFAQVRKKMKARSVKKVPGFSQIEVKGRTHVFFVGDKNHPQAMEIYRLLNESLLPLMQREDHS